MLATVREHLSVRRNRKSQTRSRQSRRFGAVLENLEFRRLLTAAPGVSPTSISITSASPYCSTGTETDPISITLPAGSIIDKVDVVLALDDTGSFASFSSTVSSIFSSLTSSLESALPGVDFAFGVTRFEDFGGPFSGVSSENTDGRPFILNQPVVNSTTAGSSAARNTLITNALANTAPGYGGDAPETDIEALRQIATGIGFDGDGNGSSADSGAAGALGTQTSPGASGDVPAFSTNVLPTSGTLGGVGWRTGALHLVILATDTSSVVPFIGPLSPVLVTGAGGDTEPTVSLGQSAVPGTGRYGLIGTTKAGIFTDAAPSGAGDVQATISALNSLGIRVLGMGPGAAPTSSTTPDSGPSTMLSSLARLTGALDGSGNPLVFDTAVSPSALTAAIVGAVTTTTTLPVDISLSTTGLPAGITFTYTTTGETLPNSLTTQVWDDVAPGGTAPFSITLTGAVHVASFNINFVDFNSGAILGTIPVTIDCPENTAPTVDITATSPINENDSTKVDGKITDPDSGDTHHVVLKWADGSADTVIDLPAGTLTFSANHQYLDDGPSPGNGTPSDTYTVTATVTDSAGASGSDTADVIVNNVAPTVLLSGPSSGVRNQPQTFTGSFTDPGTKDVWTGTIDFGDGTGVQPLLLNPDKTYSATHVYLTSGSYVVTVKISDDDTGVGTATTKIAIKAADIGKDPCDPDCKALFVGGTDSNDKIVVSSFRDCDSRGRLRRTGVAVYLNGKLEGVFYDVCKVIVYAGAGNDCVTGLESLPVPMWIFGQAGNDQLTGGAKDDLILGGAGNDRLDGGRGRDIEVGGIGADFMSGDDDDDIIVAGTTDYDWSTTPTPHEDINLTAWCKIVDEWTRCDKGFKDRSNHILGTDPTGLNKPYYLNTTTVHDDTSVDIVDGDCRNDLAFYNFTGGGVKDKTSGTPERKVDI